MLIVARFLLSFWLMAFVPEALFAAWTPCSERGLASASCLVLFLFLVLNMHFNFCDNGPDRRPHSDELLQWSYYQRWWKTLSLSALWLPIRCPCKIHYGVRSRRRSACRAACKIKLFEPSEPFLSLSLIFPLLVSRLICSTSMHRPHGCAWLCFPE